MYLGRLPKGLVGCLVAHNSPEFVPLSQWGKALKILPRSAGPKIQGDSDGDSPRSTVTLASTTKYRLDKAHGNV